jgi:Icc-related predicted phosphoesterase
MRILSIVTELICELPYLNAGRGPGDYFTEFLPVHRGYVDALPSGLAAVIATGDLQGRETFQSSAGNSPRLLGEVLPLHLVSEILPELDLPQGNTGVLLAGDFYTVPNLDKRGGSGDVTLVWEAFAREFRWVVGVAGNHDMFGNDEGSTKNPQFRSPMHFLDNEMRRIDRLQIAGLSGIVGNPRRPWRRTEDDFADTLSLLLCDRPGIMLMHDGPDIPESGFRGSQRIREVLQQSDPTLVVRGHAHWDQPLAELSCGTQVLNVDARVVILTEHTSKPHHPDSLP